MSSRLGAFANRLTLRLLSEARGASGFSCSSTFQEGGAGNWRGSRSAKCRGIVKQEFVVGRGSTDKLRFLGGLGVVLVSVSKGARGTAVSRAGLEKMEEEKGGRVGSQQVGKVVGR